MSSTHGARPWKPWSPGRFPQPWPQLEGWEDKANSSCYLIISMHRKRGVGSLREVQKRSRGESGPGTLPQREEGPVATIQRASLSDPEQERQAGCEEA